MSNLALNLWKKLSPLPMGKNAWSRMVSVKTPYFQSISPQVA